MMTKEHIFVHQQNAVANPKYLQSKCWEASVKSMTLDLIQLSRTTFNSTPVYMYTHDSFDNTEVPGLCWTTTCYASTSATPN